MNYKEVHANVFPGLAFHFVMIERLNYLLSSYKFRYLCAPRCSCERVCDGIRDDSVWNDPPGRRMVHVLGEQDRFDHR